MPRPQAPHAEMAAGEMEAASGAQLQGRSQQEQHHSADTEQHFGSSVRPGVVCPEARRRSTHTGVQARGAGSRRPGVTAADPAWAMGCAQAGSDSAHPHKVLARAPHCH